MPMSAWILTQQHLQWPGGWHHGTHMKKCLTDVIYPLRCMHGLAVSHEQQVVEVRLEQALQQRQSMEGELHSLSSSFRATTLDNQNLHRHLQA